MQPETDRDRPASARAHRTRPEEVQRRRFFLVVCLLALMVVVTAVLSRSCREDDATGSDSPGSTGASLTSATSLASATYTAELTTAASGSTAGAPTGAVLTLAYDSETETLEYRLEVTAPLANPSVATILSRIPERERHDGLHAVPRSDCSR